MPCSSLQFVAHRDCPHVVHILLFNSRLSWSYFDPLKALKRCRLQIRFSLLWHYRRFLNACRKSWRKFKWRKNPKKMKSQLRWMLKRNLNHSRKKTSLWNKKWACSWTLLRITPFSCLLFPVAFSKHTEHFITCSPPDQRAWKEHRGSF